MSTMTEPADRPAEPAAPLDPHKLRPIPELARILSEANGFRVAPSTIRSWADHSLFGQRLSVTRFGGRMFATLADVEAFLQAAEEARPTAPRGARGRRRTGAAAVGGLATDGAASREEVI
jgi:hypothetical protein